MKPDKNSTAACLWLLMLVLDADGKRKDVEFSEIQSCLAELDDSLADGGHPEVLMALLNRYYSEFETIGHDAMLDLVLHQIDDPALQQRVFVMLMRVAIADRQFHREENELMRCIGAAWGLSFEA